MGKSWEELKDDEPVLVENLPEWAVVQSSMESNQHKWELCSQCSEGGAKACLVYAAWRALLGRPVARVHVRGPRG